MTKFRLFILTILMLFTTKAVMANVIPDDVKKVVSFIFIRNERGEIVPNGTGFFVSIKEEGFHGLFGYLVTAKHVLIDEKTQNFFSSIIVRLNKANNSGTQSFEIPLIEGKNFFVHTEVDVDIAAIPFLPDTDLTKYDLRLLQQDLLTTKELFTKEKITEGDEVFFIGLFTHHIGQQRNYPITRFGRVALITEEKIKWEDSHVDLYLMESQSFGGNSGSPVFFYLDPNRVPGQLVLGPPKLLLAGIMKGSFLDAQKIGVINTQTTPISLSNMGISAVVPAYKLHEILFSRSIKEQRAERVKELQLKVSEPATEPTKTS